MAECVASTIRTRGTLRVALRGWSRQRSEVLTARPRDIVTLSDGDRPILVTSEQLRVTGLQVVISQLFVHRAALVGPAHLEVPVHEGAGFIPEGVPSRLHEIRFHHRG